MEKKDKTDEVDEVDEAQETWKVGNLNEFSTPSLFIPFQLLVDHYGNITSTEDYTF